MRSQREVLSYPARHRMYRVALADFLDLWLWRPTRQADWELSFLNRHYALHGLGSESFYRSTDCHRLFVFLDLYMEMLTLETDIGAQPFLPVGEPGIDRRVRNYRAGRLLGEALRPSSSRLRLLREHPHFHDERIREPFAQQLSRWAKIMGLDDRPRRQHEQTATARGVLEHLAAVLDRMRRRGDGSCDGIFADARSVPKTRSTPSGGISMVVAEDPTEPLAPLDWSIGTLGLGWMQQLVPEALMVALPVVVLDVFA